MARFISEGDACPTCDVPPVQPLPLEKRDQIRQPLGRLELVGSPTGFEPVFWP